ncbi:hypothetical protein DLM45_02360 [Hyphomicrobium methylovorum]|uniref:hypothetical protein n=1 Tax=Hyphomicrobium methylovorum TaxID=84 RepID=UPI0015E75830|nr:hypothetical protein [Hyphomicrobium methylovorum]MBA2125069.1 hypothetical protein [Hyphomicrobium methylovorum]
MSYIDWPAKSGASYRYWFVDMSKPFNRVAANYVFAKQLPNGNFSPLYFGETGDLSSRMPTHEVWSQAIRLGATHALAHSTQGGEQARRAEESDLIARWNPPLNTHYRTTG